MTSEVSAELNRARAKFPYWPTDPLHAIAILNEEVGELNKAVLQATYDVKESDQHGASDLLDRVYEEAAQVVAMAHRFYMNLPKYRSAKSRQHWDGIGCALCDRGDEQLGHSDLCPNRKTP